MKPVKEWPEILAGDEAGAPVQFLPRAAFRGGGYHSPSVAEGWPEAPWSACDRLSTEPSNLGHTDEDRIGAPLFEADGVGTISVGEIESRLDPEADVVYRMTKSVLTDRPKHKKPHFKLAPSIDLGPLLSTALREEASAMGFRVVPEAGNWRVSGTLHDLDVQLRQSGGGFGPNLFYGFADLELEIAHGAGKPVNRWYRTFTFIHLYNAGFGAQDEAKEALMQLLVASAQEAAWAAGRRPCLPHLGQAGCGRTVENLGQSRQSEHRPQSRVLSLAARRTELNPP